MINLFSYIKFETVMQKFFGWSMVVYFWGGFNPKAGPQFAKLEIHLKIRIRKKVSHKYVS